MDQAQKQSIKPAGPIPDDLEQFIKFLENAERILTKFVNTISALQTTAPVIKSSSFFSSSAPRDDAKYSLNINELRQLLNTLGGTLEQLKSNQTSENTGSLRYKDVHSHSTFTTSQATEQSALEAEGGAFSPSPATSSEP